MPNKRVSRSRKRELDQPDEFITLTSRFLKYTAENSKKILVGAGVVLALILIFSGLHYYTLQTEKKAYALFEKALKNYEIMLETEDPKTIYDEAKSEFLLILDTFSNTKAGKIALVTFADISYKAEEYDVAIDLYFEALKHFGENPFYRQIVLTNLAYSYEQKKDFKNAIKHMEMINNDQNMGMEDDALYHLGRLYSANHQNDKKSELFRKIIEEYPDSIHTVMIKEEIGK